MSPLESRYRFIQLLGCGTFGSVHRAIDIENNTEVAIKLPERSLSEEIAVYQHLEQQGFRGGFPPGFPRMLEHEMTATQEYIVMQRLGSSVSDYWRVCGRQFSLKTGLMLGLQMVNRLQVLHATGLVHADIKENNFVMGLQSEEDLVYIIDFGKARSYIDERTGLHVESQRNPNAVGTIAYASVHVHNKLRYSRRDDLESFAYMLIRLIRGSLPWESDYCLSKTHNDNYRDVGRRKECTTAEGLCQELPSAFTEMVKYIRALDFDELPNYDYIRGLFWRVFEEKSLENDWVFDWM